MDLIIGPGTVAPSNADTAPQTGTPQLATNGSASPFVLPTPIPAYHYNSLTSEIVNLIKALGASPDKDNWSQLAGLLPQFFAAKGQITAFSALGLAGSYTLTAPNWASRVEVYLVGGGGPGANCQGASLTGNVSGSGGGAGGIAWGVYAVTPAAQYQAIVGVQGVAAGATGGGTSSFGPANAASSFLSASGGAPGSFISNGFSPGGGGGAGVGGTILNTVGGAGSDGQAGANWRSFGNGADGPWGGHGRAGDRGAAGAFSVDAKAPAAGGGGAYDWELSGNLFNGGNGAAGLVLYRWLP